MYMWLALLSAFSSTAQSGAHGKAGLDTGVYNHTSTALLSVLLNTVQASLHPSLLPC